MVGAGVDGTVGFGGLVGVAEVVVSGASVGIAIESSTVEVGLGVGGLTPELGVEVGRGNEGSYSGKRAKTSLVPMKMTREAVTNRKTMAHALTARAVAVSCSSVNMARLCSR
jgi:hypothetical protein